MFNELYEKITEAEITNPFNVKLPKEKLTETELVAALRQSIIAEQDATALYEAYANSTENENAKKVFQSVADEEKVHIGEFTAVLKQLKPDEAGFLEDGEKEVNAGK